MKYWARWQDGTLIVAQRPSLWAYWGLFATLSVATLAIPFLGAQGIDAIGRGDFGDAARAWITLAILVALAPSMLWLILAWWRTARIDASSGVEHRQLGAKLAIPRASLSHVIVRREKRHVSTRFGSGEMPFIVLSAHTLDGRTHELLVMDESAIDARTRATLRQGIAALPFARSALDDLGA